VAGAQIALTGPLGIRAQIVPGSDGAVTFGDLYASQPFGNLLVTETLTGAELKATLEQGSTIAARSKCSVPLRALHGVSTAAGRKATGSWR
jgi:2',3'-cyclic-nucleotide 2'-phosphodiesterase (5'-nucleotidase family)